MHSDDSAWMTYAELAARLGTKPDSAARLAARKRWPRQRGNDGRARVAVPASALPEAPLPRDSAPDTAPDTAPDSAPDDAPDTAPDRDALNQTIGRLEAERDAANSALAECRLALAEARERAEREAERSTRLAVDAADIGRHVAAAEVLRETVEALKAALQAERELRAAEAALRDELRHAPARLPWWRRLVLAGAGGR